MLVHLPINELKERKRMVQKFYYIWGVTALLTSITTAPLNANELLEYGEYLAGECSSCHKKNTKTEGIPSITGIEPNSFIEILKSYKNETLKNKAMISVAKSLDDEQMKALALYFYSLKETDKSQDVK